MTVLSPGLHQISADVYHADQLADQPTLSKSIMHTLLTQSPLHAWTAHPRLNPNFARKAEDKFEIGTASHALFFEGDAGVQVCDYDSWRTAAAKEDRELARAHGKIPMLPAQWDECQAMVAALRTQLAARRDRPPIFADGKAEQTLVWQENGVGCRARLDYLRTDLTAIDDYKTTGATANPADWTRRTMWGIGADIQAAFYLRGLAAVKGAAVAGMADFRFVVQETYPPYALSVITMGATVLALADAKVDRALTVWRRCLETGEWPAYPPEVHVADLPPWIESQWLDREAREEVAA